MNALPSRFYPDRYHELREREKTVLILPSKRAYSPLLELKVTTWDGRFAFSNGASVSTGHCSGFRSPYYQLFPSEAEAIAEAIRDTRAWVTAMFARPDNNEAEKSDLEKMLRALEDFSAPKQLQLVEVP